MMYAAQNKLNVTVLAAQKFINWTDQISENYFNEIISICIGERTSQFQKITVKAGSDAGNYRGN